jgi:hypothetical protein
MTISIGYVTDVVHLRQGFFRLPLHGGRGPAKFQ